MSDIDLRQRVIDELEYDPSIEAEHIGVSADGGVITLSGHVSTYLQKLAAERATWRVRGVRGIAEEIEIRLPGHLQTADDEIARRALSVIEWHSQIPKNAVRVQVAEGWVTLGGEVEWNYQRLAAEREVRMLTGVTGVSNTITVSSHAPPSARADVIEVKDRISGALRRHAEIEASRIRIEIEGDGTVRLEGEVDDWEQRRAVEQAVWATPGVRRIDDQIRISW